MRLLRPPREGAAVAFAGARRTPGKTPWRAAGWCALDLELTGLDPRRDEIVAIGAVPIEHGRVILGKARYTLVRASKRSERAAVVIHKLRVADLATAPPPAQAAELVLEVLAGRIPVFHTAAVERAFLGPVLASRGVRLGTAADTELLGRLWLHDRDGSAPAGVALSGLASALRLPAQAPHHALGDALTTATAFIAICTHLDARAPQTVRSLLGARAQLTAARRFGHP
ncbi:MAG: exonuclease domain-containing protein [Solirubrobacteraceae bacterium]